VSVTATPPDGKPINFTARVRIDTPKEREYYRTAESCSIVLGSSRLQDSPPDDSSPGRSGIAAGPVQLAVFDWTEPSAIAIRFYRTYGFPDERARKLLGVLVFCGTLALFVLGLRDQWPSKSAFIR